MPNTTPRGIEYNVNPDQWGYAGAQKRLAVTTDAALDQVEDGAIAYADMVGTEAREAAIAHTDAQVAPVRTTANTALYRTSPLGVGSQKIDPAANHGPDTRWYANDSTTPSTQSGVTAYKAFPVKPGTAYSGYRLGGGKFMSADMKMVGSWITPGTAGAFTVTSPPGAAWVLLLAATQYVGQSMWVEGSAVPGTYVPFSTTVSNLRAPDGQPYLVGADLPPASGWVHPRGDDEEAGGATWTGSMRGLAWPAPPMSAPTLVSRVSVHGTIASSSLTLRVVAVTALTNAALTAGTVLAEAPARATADGWITADLPDPISLSTGQQVVVTVTATAQVPVTMPEWTTNPNGDRLPWGFSRDGTAWTLWSASSSHMSTPPRLEYVSPIVVDLDARVTALEGGDPTPGGGGVGGAAPRITAPTVLHAVVGDTLEVFTASVIEHPHVQAVPTHLGASVGATYPRRWVHTPTAPGDVTLTTTVRNLDGTTAATGTTTVKVAAKPTNPATPRVVSVIGDSLTAAGIWVPELARRLTGTGGTPTGLGLTNIRFVGRETTSGVGYFGVGGWKGSDYTGRTSPTAYWITAAGHGKTTADQKAEYTDTAGKRWFIETIDGDQIKVMPRDGATTLPNAPSTLTWASGGTSQTNIAYTAATKASASPFVTSAGVFSVKSWFDANNAGKGPDIVPILLGWNDIHWTAQATAIDDLRVLTKKIKAEYPSARVLLLGLPRPSPGGGLGTNYGAKESYYSDHWYLVRKVTDWNQALAALAQELGQTYVDLAAVFDAEYGYPTTTVPVNTRSTVTEERQNNGVHPNPSGYHQIADATYRAIAHTL